MSNDELDGLLCEKFKKLDGDHLQLTDVRELFIKYNTEIPDEFLDDLITLWSYNVIRFAMKSPEDTSKYIL